MINKNDRESKSPFIQITQYDLSFNVLSEDTNCMKFSYVVSSDDCAIA